MMADTKRNRVKTAVIVAVLVVAGGLGVAAAKSDHWGHGDCHGRHSDGHASGKWAPDRHMEGKLAFLKAELEITADQEQAWEEFAGVVREVSDTHGDLGRKMRQSRETGENGEAAALDERIDRRLAGMDRRMASFRTLAEAAKKLYGQLTPEQQAVADSMFSHRHGRHAMF